ncbi:MAG: AMP-binding protein [Bacteroidetes bacterium]|nr:AMP-binding protein [Bacteroidota bacterium]
MFWNLENITPNSVALIDDDSNKVYSYGELKRESDEIVDKLRFDSKKIIFSFCDNSAKSIIFYLSALRSGNAIFLANSRMDSELKKRLISIYNPEIIFSVDEISEITSGYNKVVINNEFSIYTSKNISANHSPHQDLAVLLSTSGTTGSPKLVKLSYNNIQANSESIAEYLRISVNEKPITSLPMSYSFGLSVINSHLLKGSTILCSNKSMVMREFWNTFNMQKCTSFSGVPYNYQMLQRLKFAKMDLPTLKTMTQAGGRLSEEFVKYFYEVSVSKKIIFFVMYGQTEATARISYVPFEKLGNKIGSIGIAIPGGEIKILTDGKEISASREQGELVYLGKNVMMGYAESREDLSKGDELNGVLHTGDLAYKDTDGFYYITGRLKRFIKLFGLRVNLDEVEKMLENQFSCSAACYGNDDSLKVLLQAHSDNISEIAKKKIIDIYKIHHSVIKVHCVDSIPVTSSGKKDYKLIQEMQYNECN